MSRPVRCVIMRGGTSKAVFLKEADLPAAGDERQRVILAIFGSPDPRQIDGLGGDPILQDCEVVPVVAVMGFSAIRETIRISREVRPTA